MLIKNCIAVLRANMICFLKKILHPKAFGYNAKIRFFKGVDLRVRLNGIILLGKNVKVDNETLISANGGEILIGDNVGIGRNNIIISQDKISIGKGTILAPNVFIYDHDHEFDFESGVKVKEYKKSSVIIGENCWIGANTVILRGTVIGDNCLIGAGCVIKGHYPSNSKIIQKRETTVTGEEIHENGNSN